MYLSTSMNNASSKLLSSSLLASPDDDAAGFGTAFCCLAGARGAGGRGVLAAVLDHLGEDFFFFEATLARTLLGTLDISGMPAEAAEPFSIALRRVRDSVTATPQPSTSQTARCRS